MSEHATEIDVAGAAAALEQRLAPTRETIEVARGERGRFQTRPDDEGATPAAGEAEAEVPGATHEGETPAQQTPTEEEVASFTHIPDEALTPELLAVKRSMQADYTRKTQEVAQLRDLASEYGYSSPEEMKVALDSYKTLSDPQNWPKLHEELSTYLQGQGLPAGVADQAAAVTLGESVADLEIPDLDGDFEDDLGEGAGVNQRLLAEFNQLKQQQAQMVEFIRQDQERRQQEAEVAQLAYQMTQDEHVIRTSHKDMPEDALEEYIEAVYDLASDGDLHKAAARIDSMLGRQASSWLTSKEAARQVPSPVPGAGVIASEEEEPPHTLEEGHERALAFVARQEMAQRQAGL